MYNVLTKQVYYLLMFDGQFLPYMEVLNNYPDGCVHVCVHMCIACMWLLVCMCVCVRERESKRERGMGGEKLHTFAKLASIEKNT